MKQFHCTRNMLNKAGAIVVSTEGTTLIGHISDVVWSGRGSDFVP